MASRYYSQFPEKKVSATGARPSLPRAGSPGSPAPSWGAGGPSSAPTWKPGDVKIGGWPGGFYPGPHPGVENEMHGMHKGKSRKKVEAAMREVHEDEPSTVTRAKHFGPGGKEAMLRAIALSKARKAGAKVPKKK